MVKLSGEKNQYVTFPSTSFEKETLIRMRVFQLLVLPKLASFPNTLENADRKQLSPYSIPSRASVFKVNFKWNAS